MRETIEFEDGMNGALKCPECGEYYLHHGKVTVYDRDEDEETTTETTINDGKGAMKLVPSRYSRNPSSRRDGLAVEFNCENCDEATFEMTIEQHKGQTYLRWRRV